MDGLNILKNEIMKRLPEGPPYFPADSVTDQTERSIAAELIREDAELRALQEQAIGQPKGLAYLTQQKLVKAVRSAMEQRADQLAQDFYGRIRRSVSDVRVDPLKKADGASTMLLNVSCLMPEGSDELGSELDEIQKTTGVTVRFTGPWPPYSFVGG